MQRVWWMFLVFATAFGLGCTELDAAPSDAGTTDMDGGLDGNVDEGGPDGSDDGEIDESDGGPDADLPSDGGPARDGGMDASDGAVDGDYTVDEFCEDLEVAVCAWQTAEAAARDASAPCDLPDLYVKSICDGPIQNAIEEGRVSYDAEAARACIALHELGEEAPRGQPPLFAAFGTTEVCAKVVAGSLDDGDECFPAAVLGGSECSDGVCPFVLECPSTCVAFRDVGESCDQQAEFCREGTYCRSDSFECAAYGALGDSCEDGLALCGDELYCNEGMCAPLEDVNGACEYDADCVSGVCAYPDQSSAMGLCVVPQDEGGSCQLTGGCKPPLLCVLGECALQDNEGTCLSKANCDDDEECMYIGARDGYFCEVPVPVGSTCMSSGPQCEGGAWCSTEDFETYSCTLPGVTGDSCRGTRFCANDTHYCDHEPSNARCHARGALDEACTRGDNYTCLPDLQCAWDDTCRALGLAENAPCSPTIEGACDDGLFCDRQTHTCVPVRGEDGVCNLITKEGCEDDLYCACEGECTWDPAVADADEQCRRKLANNTVCDSDEQCLSGYCNSVCQARPQEGDDAFRQVLMCNGL